MDSPRSKHVVLLVTQTLLSKYSCVLTDTNSVYYTVITQRDVTYKDSHKQSHPKVLQTSFRIKAFISVVPGPMTSDRSVSLLNVHTVI
jgi:hypothetical protein